MTAHELAKLLLDGPDLPVYVRGYEDGIDDITAAEQVTVVRDINPEWYYGAHDTVFDQSDHPDKPRSEGIYLSFREAIGPSFRDA